MSAVEREAMNRYADCVRNASFRKITNSTDALPINAIIAESNVIGMTTYIPLTASKRGYGEQNAIVLIETSFLASSTCHMKILYAQLMTSDSVTLC